MQTYSHFLMTAAIQQPLQRRGIPVRMPWFLLGSVMPDLPFLLLTLVYEAYFLWVSPLTPDQTPSSIMTYLHFDLFFHDPIWLIGHNFFHAPLVLLLTGGGGWMLHKRGNPWGVRLLWFALAAGLHTLIDIGTHHSDGPLIFFPFSLTYRFASPISYWETAYYGRIFAPLEIALDGLLLVYLFWRWRLRKSASL